MDALILITMPVFQCNVPAYFLGIPHFGKKSELACRVKNVTFRQQNCHEKWLGRVHLCRQISAVLTIPEYIMKVFRTTFLWVLKFWSSWGLG